MLVTHELCYPPNMKPIKYLVSVDGFYISNTFHPKELSILDLDDWDDRSIFTERYQIDETIDLCADSRKYIGYLRRFVHGLKFSNSARDKPQADLIERLRRLIAVAVDRNVLIGHKGGPHTRDLLTRLGATNNLVNLDDLGCPKFGQIYGYFSRYMSSYAPCANHRWIVDPRMCSRLKLIAYRIWLVSVSLVASPQSSKKISSSQVRTFVAERSRKREFANA